MHQIWITYSWEDNKNNDIDYIAQELSNTGLKVKLDRWNIQAGLRLWEQIEHFIKSEKESDAWIFIMSQNSLLSEKCKEEFNYALDRALGQRGKKYPIIGLFLSPIDESIIPLGIKTRLYISIKDPDWKERIKASVEERDLNITTSKINPYYFKIHNVQGNNRPYVIELRPRAGTWAPFIVAIPLEEKEIVDPSIMVGPNDLPTNSGMLINTGEGPTSDGKWYAITSGNKSTPVDSYYVWCKKLPSLISFGANGRPPQYTIKVN